MRQPPGAAGGGTSLAGPPEEAERQDCRPLPSGADAELLWSPEASPGQCWNLPSVRVLCAPGDNWRVHTHHFTGPVPSGPRWIRRWDGGGGTVKWGAFWAAPHGVARGGQAPPSLGSLGSAPSLGPGGEKCTPRPAPHPPWGAAPAPPRKESLHHPPVKPPPQPRALPCQSLARVTGTAFPVLCSDV